MMTIPSSDPPNMSAAADRAQLAIRADGELTAAQAIAWFAVGDPGWRAVGFALSATAARWFRIVGASAVGEDGGWSWDGVFEVRAFDGDRELRWLNVAGGLGHAVILAEAQAAQHMPAGFDVSLLDVSARRRRERREFAGTVTATSGAWSTLFEARYEPVRVPITAEVNERVAIVSIEYVSCDEHGNLAVLDARLAGLVTLPPLIKPEARHVSSTTGGGI